MISEEKNRGGDIQKYSLEYRLQNDNDEGFVDTYKAAIVKDLLPGKRPASNPHGPNLSMYDSPIRRNFISRKMNTGHGSRPKKNILVN